MLFRCKNCNGNVVYSPEKGRMLCLFCDSIDSEEGVPVNSTITCPACSGEFQVSEVTSATKCGYCGNYMIFDERVSGQYTPHLIMPFKLSKERVKTIMRKEFGKKKFAPDNFLSDAKLSTMEGMYVPFWMYDFKTNYDFQGKGTKVRSWMVGNVKHVETSYYNVFRNIDITFDKIPADASILMDDSIMDLMEPYDYKALETFQEKYMSGFFAEKYNMPAEQLEPRARQKVTNDSETILNSNLSGYASMTPVVKNLTMQRGETEYALMPVWIYTYQYGGRNYIYHINGQTGKVIGVAPVSKKKVWAYSGTVFAALSIIGVLVNAILEVL